MILKQPIRPELKVLLATCFENRAMTPAETLNSDLLQKLVSYHGIRPQFLAFAHQNNLDVSFRSSLTDFYQKIAINNLLSVRQQIQIIRLLEDNGIESYAYKGSLWADWLYGDVGKREFGDIDLLIKPDQCEKALEILRNIGYSPDEYRRYLLGSPERKVNFFATDYHIPLENLSMNAASMVEMHWQVAYPRLRFDFPSEEWDQHRTSYELHKAKINAFQNEYQFLLLIAHHGGKEHWSRIKYIADFAAYMLRYGGSTNWKLVENLAKNKGILKLYQTSLGLLRALGIDWQKGWPENVVPGHPAPFINAWESMPIQAENSTWPYFVRSMSVHDGFKFKSKVLLSHLKYLGKWKLLLAKMQWYSSKGS